MPENRGEISKEALNVGLAKVFLKGVKTGWDHTRAYEEGVECRCQCCVIGLENPAWMEISWWAELRAIGIPDTWEKKGGG